MFHTSNCRAIISTTSTTTIPQNQNDSNPLVSMLLSKNTLVLGVAAMVLVFLALKGDKGGAKGKLSKGIFGGQKEKNKAAREGKKQIINRKHNKITLYLGRPNTNSNYNLFANLQYKPPLFLPDAQRGIAVMGGPGSGKTFSVIDQSLLSAIDQGFPVLLYDFKYPTQSERIAGYAQSKGYRVNVFSPGYPESEICNPLDFLKDDSDALMARQFAEVMNRNFKKEGNQASDQFFTAAGDQLTEAILMLAKGTPYPDIMTCQALLSLTDLPQRLMSKKSTINPWIYSSFGQLISVANSEKTVASIIATANSNFTSFMKADILGSFVGKSTIPLDLQGKQMLILGLDREKRDVLSPLLATILHLIVNRNVTKKRKDPLFLCLDELPTLFLPSLTNWLNENREDGLATLIGFQNIVQLEKIYGKELSRAILGGCATKAVFNPQDAESAKMFAEYLGDQEVSFKSKSKGTSGGKSSSNVSEQNQTKKLFPAEEFLKLPTGKCILINPSFRRKDESYIPLKEKIHISPEYLKIRETGAQHWQFLVQRLKRTTQKVSDQDIQNRRLLSEQLYPNPKQTSSHPINTDTPVNNSSTTNNHPNNTNTNETLRNNFEKFSQFV